MDKTGGIGKNGNEGMPTEEGKATSGGRNPTVTLGSTFPPVIGTQNEVNNQQLIGQNLGIPNPNEGKKGMRSIEVSNERTLNEFFDLIKKPKTGQNEDPHQVDYFELFGDWLHVYESDTDVKPATQIVPYFNVSFNIQYDNTEVVRNSLSSPNIPNMFTQIIYLKVKSTTVAVLKRYYFSKNGNGNGLLDNNKKDCMKMIAENLREFKIGELFGSSPFGIKPLMFKIIHLKLQKIMVTELLFEYGGTSIEKLLEPNPEEQLKYLDQLVAAIKYMENIMIEHNDLKPENILLGTFESFDIFKIIDFNVGFNPSITEGPYNPQEKRGRTLYYYSPEYSSNNKQKKVNPWKSQIFSLGIVMLKIMCVIDPGEPDYKEHYINYVEKIGENYYDSFVGFITKKFSEKYKQDPNILSLKIMEIIKNCISYNPENRLTAHSLHQLIKDIENVNLYEMGVTIKKYKENENDQERNKSLKLLEDNKYIKIHLEDKKKDEDNKHADEEMKIQKLQKELNVKNELISQLKNDYKSLEDLYQNSVKLNEELNKKNILITNQLKQLRESNERLNEQNNSYFNKINQKEKKIIDLNKELRDGKSKIEKEYSQLIETVQEIEKVGEIKETIEKLTAKNEELHKDKENLNLQYQNLMKTLDTEKRILEGVNFFIKSESEMKLAKKIQTYMKKERENQKEFTYCYCLCEYLLKNIIPNQSKEMPDSNIFKIEENPASGAKFVGVKPNNSKIEEIAIIENKKEQTKFTGLLKDGEKVSGFEVAPSTKYMGSYLNGKYNGFGMKFFSVLNQSLLQSLEYYVGEWKDGEMHGKGKFVNKDGEIFEGTWRKNKKNGKGIIIDGSFETITITKWVDDIQNGQGMIIKKKSVQKCTWKNGKLDGRAIVFNFDTDVKVEELYEGGEKKGNI